MSDTIRIITYEDIDASTTDDQVKSINASGTPFLKFDEIETPSETPSQPGYETGAKGIGKFEVKVDTLEAEMGHLVDVVQRLLKRAEQKTKSDIALEEVELLVEINGNGKISILGTGGQVGGKGAIKLKFKRQQR
ncbi:MAG: hypothetical protein QNJ68_16930 [Microcoleaceae cyanobacterium MO_207.B10]|nr:hypothetical protein [Microcoleaceae cyanobacterium MO_207.B10]